MCSGFVLACSGLTSGVEVKPGHATEMPAFTGIDWTQAVEEARSEHELVGLGFAELVRKRQRTTKEGTDRPSTI